MSRPPAPDVLNSSAEEVRAAAGLLRDGRLLTEPSRAALVDLLEHLADCCELVPTTLWDRTARLAIRVEDHQLGADPLPPPNVGGGIPRS